MLCVCVCARARKGGGGGTSRVMAHATSATCTDARQCGGAVRHVMIRVKGRDMRFGVKRRVTLQQFSALVTASAPREVMS